MPPALACDGFVINVARFLGDVGRDELLADPALALHAGFEVVVIIVLEMQIAVALRHIPLRKTAFRCLRIRRRAADIISRDAFPKGRVFLLLANDKRTFGNILVQPLLGLRAA